MFRTILALIALAAPSLYCQTGDQLTTSYDALKAAQEKNDVEQVKKLSLETAALAKKVVDSTRAAEDTEESWNARLDYARHALAFSDYALFAVALNSSDNKVVIDLYETLESKNASSEYVPQLIGRYTAALIAIGKPDKAFTAAEKGLAKHPNNEDLLLIAANGCLTRKAYDRAGTYGTRLASVMNTHGKPEGMSAGDWERRKTLLIGRGYWIAGIAYSNVNKYTLADDNLRKSLPFVKGDPQMTAGALFYLGLANYNLGRAMHEKPRLNEALQFSKDAVAIPGALQAQAQQNVYAIQNDLRTFR